MVVASDVVRRETPAFDPPPGTGQSLRRPEVFLHLPGDLQFGKPFHHAVEALPHRIHLPDEHGVQPTSEVPVSDRLKGVLQILHRPQDQAGCQYRKKQGKKENKARQDRQLGIQFPGFIPDRVERMDHEQLESVEEVSLKTCQNEIPAQVSGQGVLGKAARGNQLRNPPQFEIPAPGGRTKGWPVPIPFPGNGKNAPTEGPFPSASGEYLFEKPDLQGPPVVEDHENPLGEGISTERVSEEGGNNLAEKIQRVDGQVVLGKGFEEEHSAVPRDLVHVELVA